jgi:hemerythrin
MINENQIGIAWNDKYKLGNEQVDLQHRKLFEMVNDLINSSMETNDSKKLQETLDFLIQYTVRHFHFEEQLQLQYKYPEYESHKKMHEDFKVTVGEFAAKLAQDGPSAELFGEFNTIVVRWLVNHVQREDKKIAAYIQN